MVIVSKDGNDAIKIVMYEKAKVKLEGIPVLLSEYKDELQFKIETNPYFIYQKKGKNLKDKDENIIGLVKKLLNDIKGLIE